MQTKPIREIVNTSALRPVGRGGVVRDRRSSDRFPCKLPAALSADGREYPIECLEISKAGLRVSSLRPIPLATDQIVRIRIRIGVQNFADQFRVVRVSRNLTGPMSIHLALHAEQPASVPAG